MSFKTHYRKINIDGIEIFYREAGDSSRPTILLLHGFPSSSHMYRDLITNLADDFHLVAPDYPGFGNSAMPLRTAYRYTFDNLSHTIENFVDAMGLKRFTLYMHDYGSPVGFRIATRRPGLIEALIIQNANAYEEGLGPAIDDGKRFWANRTAETEKAMKQALTLEGTMFQYLHGVNEPEAISPDAHHYDQHFLNRPGNSDIQLDLLYDYLNNIKLYTQWQKYLREHRPPTLVVWGKNDLFFTAEGALAYKKDLPDAKVVLLDSGHFALEEYHQQISEYIRSYLFLVQTASKH